MTITIPPPAAPPGGSALPPRAMPTTIPAGATPAPPTGSAAPSIDLIPSLLGALAVLAATLAIPPMIVGSSWVGPTIEVVLVIWAVGVGARLARVPVVAAIGLQILGAAIALTALFTVGGIAGVIPNGAVIGEAGDLLTGAWEQIRTNVSPAPSSSELSFLICLSVGITALIVDILIAVCRAPALVALPLLCVYSVPASMDLSMLPWEAFAAPAMIYALLLVASGLAGRRHGAGAGLAQVINGAGLGALATVVALLVAGTVTGVGTEGRLPRTPTGQSTGIGLSPFASLRGSLLQSEPVDLLRVSGLDSPHYLRTIGLQSVAADYQWSVDELADGDLPATTSIGDDRLVTINSSAYRDQFLPIYNGTDAISGIDSGWTYDAALESVHRPEATTPGPYQVSAGFEQPSAEQLRSDSVTSGGELTATGELPAEVVTIATDVTAGANTAFDKADALRSYFTDPVNGFSYSLEVPEGPTSDALVNFLTNKKGYCEQYASAMAIMLRAIGIPARVAIGFTQGTLDPADNSYVITSNDAHAWVEVDFDGAGWVQFDPTPLGGGQGGQQGFTDNGEAAPTTDVTASAPATAPGLEPDDGGDNSGPTAAPTTAGAGGAAGGDAEPVVPTWMWWTLVVILLIGAAAAGPTVVRRRRRQQRLLLAEAGGSAGAVAAWREIEDLAVDHGIPLNPAESARATANRLAKAAHLHDQGRAELRAVVQAAEQGWYGRDEPSASQGGSATPVSDSRGGIATLPSSSTTTLAPAAKTMAAELQHTVPLSLLDRLVPKSVRPSWWRY
ncbi:MAG: DUF3488 and transglutaminase-like domain-containing protein [Nakamurella sp.]